MAKFKEKNFGFIEDVKTGAIVGASIGGGTTNFLNQRKKKLTVRNIAIDTIAGATVGGLVGAALGAVASGIKNLVEKVERKRSINYRLMPAVVGELSRLGHKEGMSFTRDPKMADRLKTKVSIVVYRFSDDLRVIVNTMSDPKLERIMNQVTHKIADTSRGAIFKEETSGKFKDLKITAISDPSTDAGYIAWIASTFINNGYPVYLVEVG